MARDDVGFMQAVIECCRREPFSRSPRLLEAVAVCMGYGEEQLSDCRDAQGVLTLDLLSTYWLVVLCEDAYKFAQAIVGMAHDGDSWYDIQEVPELWIKWHGIMHYGRTQ